MYKNKKSHDQDIFERMFHSELSGHEKQTSENGKIIVTETKENLSNVKGHIINPSEIMSWRHDISHITPNTYYTAGYNKEGKFYGHSDNNLRQINVFAIDIDSVDKSQINLQDILLKGEEVGLQPTLVIDTPKGYHLMFYLKTPLFVTGKSKKERNMFVDRVKRVSTNLRSSYSELISGIDVYCNHFGFFRSPRHDNVLYYNTANIYSYKEFVEFSIEYEKKTIDKRYINNNTVPFRRLKTIREPWFNHLYNVTDIAGQGDGIIARDNAIFTMALHLYANKVSKEEATNLMHEWNRKLNLPLQDKVVVEKVNSAYSGRYKGAAKKYILNLLYSWCELANINHNRLFFRKHAKKREERERVHFDEWKQDLYQYINKHAKNGIVKTTRTELCNALGFSKSTLKVLLKDDQMFYSKTTKGKYAVMIIATRKSLVQHALNKVKGKKIKSTTGLKRRLNVVFKPISHYEGINIIINQTIEYITKEFNLGYIIRTSKIAENSS